MLINLKFLKISNVLFYLILITSCVKTEKTLDKVTTLTNKKVIINDTKTVTSSMFKFKGKNYPIEKDLYFDYNGNLIKMGVSKSEGLLFYYRKPNEFQLKLEKNYHVKIDKINNLIIDNKDTVKSFTIDYSDKIIYWFNENNRINIYRFK